MTVSEARRLQALDRAIGRHRSGANGEGERHAQEVAGRAGAGHAGTPRASDKKVAGMRRVRNRSGGSVSRRLVVQHEAVAHVQARPGLSEGQASGKRSGGLFVVQNGLPDCRGGSQDDPLHITAPARHGAANAAARSCQ